MSNKLDTVRAECIEIERKALMQKYRSPTVIDEVVAKTARKYDIPKYVARRLLVARFLAEVLEYKSKNMIVDKEDERQALHYDPALDPGRPTASGASARDFLDWLEPEPPPDEPDFE